MEEDDSREGREGEEEEEGEEEGGSEDSLDLVTLHIQVQLPCPSNAF